MQSQPSELGILAIQCSAAATGSHDKFTEGVSPFCLSLQLLLLQLTEPPSSRECLLGASYVLSPRITALHVFTF